MRFLPNREITILLNVIDKRSTVLLEILMKNHCFDDFKRAKLGIYAEVPKFLHCLFTDCQCLTRRHAYPNPSFPFSLIPFFRMSRSGTTARLSGGLHDISWQAGAVSSPHQAFRLYDFSFSQDYRASGIGGEPQSTEQQTRSLVPASRSWLRLMIRC